MRNKWVMVVLAASLMTASVGCGPKVPPALVAKAAATTVVSGSVDALDVVYQDYKNIPAGLVPAAANQTVLTAFQTAFTDLSKASVDLQKVQPGETVPASVSTSATALKDLITALNTAVPNSHALNALVDKVVPILNNITLAAGAIGK